MPSPRTRDRGSLSIGVVALCLVLICGLAASRADAANLYMAPTGADSSDCQSQAAPCASFSYVQSRAAGTVGADTVHLAAGDYTPDGAYLSTANVTWAGPQAGVPAPGRSGPEARVLVRAGNQGLGTLASNITFDGLTFQSSDYGASSGWAAINAVRAPTIRNVRITHVQLGVYSDEAVTLTNSDIDTTYDAIQVPGGTISNNTIAAATGRIGITLTGALPATITGNTFTRGLYAVRSGSGTAALRVNGNRFGHVGYGLSVGSSASADATNNWWGCNAGPWTGSTVAGCAGVSGASVTTEPHLVLRGEVDPSAVYLGDDTEIRATLDVNSAGEDVGPMLAGTPIAFGTDGGTLADDTVALDSDGVARTTLTAPATEAALSPRVWLDGQTVTLSLAVTAELLTDPLDLDLGSVNVGAGSSTRAFTITNPSGAPIRISSVALTGADPDQFVLWSNACRTTLPAGASCGASVALRPTSAGAKSAVISVVAENVSDAFTAQLTGQATADDTIGLDSDQLNFRQVSVGDASDRLVNRIVNDGSEPLQITSITTTGDSADFVVSAGDCRRTIEPGDVCGISASFRPQAAGARTATVTIRAIGHAPKAFTLAGTGVSAALDVTPPDGRFGTVRVGGSSTKRVFTLTNNGATQTRVTIGTIKLTGADLGSFTLYAGGCANQALQVGESCEISAIFRPQSVGARHAAISISAAGQPARTIDLAGTGA